MSALLIMACGGSGSSNQAQNNAEISEQNNLVTSDANLSGSVDQALDDVDADTESVIVEDDQPETEQPENDSSSVAQPSPSMPLNPAPFFGSIYVDPDIIRRDDPTTYVSSSYVGRGYRVVYDRREGWVTILAYLFEAVYSDGKNLEFQINPEFGSVAAAQSEVDFYAPPIGRVPTGLRENVASVTIHKGKEPYGGGNKNLLIHTGQTDIYESRDILEETFVHEAAHATLDGFHAMAAAWQDAQSDDNGFITEYAQAHPVREDIAESFLFYLAVRYRAERISENLYNTIMTSMPHRIAYFDQQQIDVYPVD